MSKNDNSFSNSRSKLNDRGLFKKSNNKPETNYDYSEVIKKGSSGIYNPITHQVIFLIKIRLF